MSVFLNPKFKAVLHEPNYKINFVSDGYDLSSPVLGRMFTPDTQIGLENIVTSDAFVTSVPEYQWCGNWKILGFIQYIGVKDENKTEIYLGDILDIKSYGVGEVVFNDGAYKIKWKDKGAKDLEISSILRDKKTDPAVKIYVIGNTHSKKPFKKVA